MTILHDKAVLHLTEPTYCITAYLGAIQEPQQKLSLGRGCSKHVQTTNIPLDIQTILSTERP